MVTQTEFEIKSNKIVRQQLKSHKIRNKLANLNQNTYYVYVK